MNASIVVAICATVIAVLSLAVSVYEARAARRHDRISVRPHLALQATLRQGSQAGLQLVNAGLGPAAITRTVLTLDGEARLAATGARPVTQIDYWQANGGVTYQDPDGREVVFASWIYDPQDPGPR